MILQEHLQDTATNNPTKFSTKPATTEATTGLQHTLCQLLHHSITITFVATATTITSPLIVYSRETRVLL